jgi:hypothetical protein
MVIVNFKRVSIFVCILSLLSSYVVSLPKPAIASPQLQVIQIAQANITKQDDVKTRLSSLLKQLFNDLDKTSPFPLTEEQKTKLDKDIESIDNSINTLNNKALKNEWDDIKASIKPIRSISGRVNDSGIRDLQKILMDKEILLPPNTNDGEWGEATASALKSYLNLKKDNINALPKNLVSVDSPTIPETKPTTVPSARPNNEQNNLSGVGILLLGLFGVVLLIGLVSSLLMIYILRGEIKKLRYNLSNTAQAIKAQNLQDITQKNTEIRKIRDEQKKQIDQITNLERQLGANIERISYPEKKIGRNIETETYNQNVIYPTSQKVQHQNHSDIELYQEPESPSEPSLADRIVQNYNHDPNKLVEYSTRVSETQESKSKRRTDSNYPIALGEIDNGFYWILTFQNESTQWLVPMGDLEITKYILKTLEALFDCSGKTNSKFVLIQPAMVIATSEGEWHLEKRGEIEFTE